MANFKILDTSSLSEENFEERYINPCFPSLDATESGKASPEQLTVSTIVGFESDAKEPTKVAEGE